MFLLRGFHYLHNIFLFIRNDGLERMMTPQRVLDPLLTLQCRFHRVRNAHHISQSRLQSQGFNSAPIRRRYANERRTLHSQAGDD